MVKLQPILSKADALKYGTNFISVMHTTLFGLNNNYDIEISHILPALPMKFQLGRFLERADWDSIYAYVRKRPIKVVNEPKNRKQILDALAH